MKRLLMLVGLSSTLVLSAAACQQPSGTGPEEAAPTEEGAPAEEATPAEEAAPTEATMTDGAADPMAFDPASKGGTLIIGQEQEPDTLYRLGGSMLAASHILNSIYDGPIEGMDYDFQAVILEDLPKLENGGATLEMVTVEAGQQYVDPETQEVVTATQQVADLGQLTVTFKMVDGLTWDDGTPVTADDSVFAEDLSCNPLTPTSKFTCDRTASYTKIDDKTVEWKGLPGFTDQTYYTNFYAPLPRHQKGADGTAMSEMAADAILKDETFTRKPMSYGPFKITEWTSGEKIVLEKNEHYWRASEGLPFLDSVVHRFIPESNTLLQSLKAGEIDVALGLTLEQYDGLTEAEAAGEVKAYTIVGTSWEHIDFNLNPTDDRVPVAACAEVRKAIAHGTDRQNMVDTIQKGKTQVQHTFIPEDHWAFPPEGVVTVYDYDPEAAKTMLETLGFTDGDGDGIREASKDITCTITTDVNGTTKDQTIPAGTALELTLNTTEGNALREQSTLLFQQNMKDIGIQVNLEYLAAAVYFEDGPEGPLFGRRFDLGQFGWLTGVQPPVGLYYCSEIPSEENAWAGQNETGWCDPEYDQTAKRADTTLKRDEALPLYHEAQRIFSESVPVLPLFARVKVFDTRPEVVNFKPNPTINSETWNVEAWGFAEGAATAP